MSDQETQPSGMTSEALVNRVTELLSASEERHLLEKRQLLAEARLESQKDTEAAIVRYADVVDVVMEGRLKPLTIEQTIQGDQLRAIVARQDNLNERVGRFEGRFEQVYKERDEERAEIAALKTQFEQALELGSAILMDSPKVRARAHTWFKEELKPYVRLFVAVVVLVNVLCLLVGWYLIRGGA